MTDDPTEVWREAMREQVHGLLDSLKPQPDGEDTVEQMRGRWEACSRHREHIQKRLSETQRDLAASQADLTRAEQDLAEAREMCGELAKELAAVSYRLTLAEKARGEAIRGLEQCAWRGIAEDLMREQPGGIYPARQDVGPCVLCGQLIVRGHWVEARHDSTTKPEWAHAHGICPDKEN